MRRACVRLLKVAGLITALSLALSATASATACTWQGTVSTDWTDGGNWTGCTGTGGVPSASDAVSIGSAGNQPALASGSAKAGTVDLSSGATLTVNGGELEVSNGITVASGANVSLSSGTLSFETLGVAAASGLTVTGGEFDGGTVTATADTTVSIAPTTSDGFTVGSNVTLDQTADMTLNGGTLAIGGHTYQLTNSASILAGSGSITIGSSGKLQKQGGIFQSTIQPQIISSGTIEDLSDSGGSLQLQPTVAADQLSGTVLAHGQTFTFGNGNYQIESPGLTVGGDGGSEGTSGSAHFDLNGQTITLASAGSGLEMQSGASITGTGTVAGVGALDLNSSGIAIAPGSGHTITISASVLQLATTDLSAAGTIDLSGKWFCFSNLTDTGGTSLHVVPGGNFRHVGNSNVTVSAPITDAGTVEQYVASNAKMTINTLSVSTGGAVVDGVPLPGSPPPSGSRELDIGSLTNLSGGTLTGGSYSVGQGSTLGLPGAVTHLVNASVEVDGTGSVSPAFSGLSIGSGGVLSGTGTIPGDVVNGGVVAPGTSDAPGTLSIGGSYTQTAGGKLSARVNGTSAGDFDALSVAQNATLGGTLALVPSSAYAVSAAAGDTASLLTFSGTRSGKFSALTSTPALSAGKGFAVVYDDGNGAVNAVVGSLSAASTLPSVSGTAVQGHVLAASRGTWTGGPASYTYAWERCSATGTGCSVIPSATGTTYRLAAVDVGHTLRVRVTATNAYGPASATSRQSAKVAPPPPPMISGVHVRNGRLTLTLSEPAKLSVAISGKAVGRKVKGRCKVGAKKGKRCTTNVKTLRLSFNGPAGTKTFAFSKRKPGRYTVTITARDSGGRVSKPVVVRLKMS